MDELAKLLSETISDYNTTAKAFATISVTNVNILINIFLPQVRRKVKECLNKTGYFYGLPPQKDYYIKDILDKNLKEEGLLP